MKKYIFAAIGALIIIFLAQQVVTKNTADMISFDESFSYPTEDSNVNVYTSPRLGVKFKYAVVDPLFSTPNDPSSPQNTVIEEGNILRVSNGGIVKVFSKDPNVSLENEIKARFVSSSCVVVITESDAPANLFIDIQYPDLKTEFGPVSRGLDFAGDPVMTEADQKCLKETSYAPSYFIADGRFPERYAAVEASAQSPEGVLYVLPDSGVQLWMSTVEFFEKS